MIILIILVCFFTNLCAGPQEEVFLQAGQLYNAADYEKAYKLYQEIEPKDSLVLYNMGNCSYRCGNLPEAYLLWKRAEKNATVSLYCNIQQNLQVCSQQLNMAYNASVLKQIFTPLYIFIVNSAFGMMQMLFLVFWYGLFLVIILRLQSYRFIRNLLILGTVCSAMLVGMKYYTNNRQYGMVCKDGASLYAGPHKNYHTFLAIPKLDMLTVLEQKNGWYKVLHGNGKGWMPEDFIEIV